MDKAAVLKVLQNIGWFEGLSGMIINCSTVIVDNCDNTSNNKNYNNNNDNNNSNNNIDDDDNDDDNDGDDDDDV